MTAGSVTPEIFGIVSLPGIHVDIAIPMISNGVRTLIEQGIFGGRFQTTVSRGLAHAVTHGTCDMVNYL